MATPSHGNDNTKQQTSKIINKIIMDVQSGRSTMFPVLKNSVILQIMEEINVPLKEMELVEPGRCKERVREVFVQLVSGFLIKIVYCTVYNGGKFVLLWWWWRLCGLIHVAFILCVRWPVSYNPKPSDFILNTPKTHTHTHTPYSSACVGD